LNPTILGLEQRPNKPFKSINSHEQFIKFVKDASNTYEQYKNRSFWLIAQFDKRGRMYYRGYHINIQGNGFQKALMDFAELSPIEGTL
jgi:DNA-directed RNA polymerase